MRTEANTRPSIQHLHKLAAFTRYLLENRQDDLARVQIAIAEEMQMRLLGFFANVSTEQRFAIVKEANAGFLGYLANNQARQQIENSLAKWRADMLPVVQKQDIMAEDITQIFHLRKRSFLHFITDYTRNIDEAIEIIGEIDLFFAEAEIAGTNTYISLLKGNIDEHAHFIEKITNTIPGIIFVYDVENNREVYANKVVTEFLGFTPEEITGMGSDFVPQLIHPDDQLALEDYERDFKTIADGETRSFNYRIRNNKGEYRWMRSFETAFRRNASGEVTQKIGIAIDVHEQKITADELEKREKQLMEVLSRLRENEKRFQQAEAITHIGSYHWNLGTNELIWSDELYRIYGLDPATDSTDFELISSFNHPEDTPIVRREYQRAIAENAAFDFYYRIHTKTGEEKIIHARGTMILGENGQTTAVMGTAQDVTERQRMIVRLQHSEFVHKQAEELANMGNWSWDVRNNRLEWSDHLYRVYGLEPQSETITIESFLDFVHPDDRAYVRQGVEEIKTTDLIDYTFRIRTREGKIKILRSVAQVRRDDKGKPLLVIGTERDVTEKQTLINRLQSSERLYKQAQSLAQVGNWSWNVTADILEWSDELYRIYGIEPGTPLSYEKYAKHLHPDDAERVKSQVQRAFENGESWEFTHRLIRPDGETRIVNATGEVLRDANGKVQMMVGTAQDITERQMLIERLQESQRLSRQAQSLARLGNWSMDIRTKQISWSDEMYKIYEMDRSQDFDFEKWLQHLDEAEREEIMAYYEECLAERKIYDRIHRIHLHNGKIKIIHRKGEFVLNDAGEPVKMVGTTQDITEEYRVQQELKENQTFIRKITDATPSIIASYNVNSGEYVFVSEGLEKLLGYSPDLVMEKGITFFADIVHPEDAIQIMEKNARALEDANTHPEKNDLVVEFTYRMRHRNGQYRWFHTYGTIFDRNAEDKVEHVLNISLDVTEQVEASQKIKEQEHFIQQIADASPTILYLYDVEKQKIAYINREIFFVLGYLPDEILQAGSEVTSLLYHPEDYHLLPGRKQSGKTFQQVDSMIQYECRMKNKEDEWRWLLVREIVFKTDENGNITQILGAALDINRRKEMEKTILQNTILLEQSNASLEEFAYVASHDLKEPLRKISTFGDRLVATQLESLAPEGKIYLQKIVDASQRMQTMISDLLSISMITGNTAFENYSLQKILDETLQTLEFKIEQQNAVIHADALPEAKIIPSQFRQLFQNLMSNSLKFMQPGVQPRLTIRHAFVNAADLVHYQLAEADKYHKLEFIDNGIGFENEYAGKIFAIFQRLHGRSEYEGSGIGLAICKKIVEHHGGIIYANGNPGAGANFTIILPT